MIISNYCLIPAAFTQSELELLLL